MDCHSRRQRCKWRQRIGGEAAEETYLNQHEETNLDEISRMGQDREEEAPEGERRHMRGEMVEAGGLRRKRKKGAS